MEAKQVGRYLTELEINGQHYVVGLDDEKYKKVNESIENVEEWEIAEKAREVAEYGQFDRGEDNSEEPVLLAKGRQQYEEDRQKAETLRKYEEIRRQAYEGYDGAPTQYPVLNSDGEVMHYQSIVPNATRVGAERLRSSNETTRNNNENKRISNESVRTEAINGVDFEVKSDKANELTVTLKMPEITTTSRQISVNGSTTIMPEIAIKKDTSNNTVYKSKTATLALNNIVYSMCEEEDIVVGYCVTGYKDAKPLIKPVYCRYIDPHIKDAQFVREGEVDPVTKMVFGKNGVVIGHKSVTYAPDGKIITEEFPYRSIQCDYPYSTGSLDCFFDIEDFETLIDYHTNLWLCFATWTEEIAANEDGRRIINDINRWELWDTTYRSGLFPYETRDGHISNISKHMMFKKEDNGNDTRISYFRVGNLAYYDSIKANQRYRRFCMSTQWPNGDVGSNTCMIAYQGWFYYTKQSDIPQ